jgi:hypothetical protein
MLYQVSARQGDSDIHAVLTKVHNYNDTTTSFVNTVSAKSIKKNNIATAFKLPDQ